MRTALAASLSVLLTAPLAASAEEAAPAPRITQKRNAHLTAAERLYQKLDLEAALAELDRAEINASEADSVRILVYRGLVFADQGKTNEANDQFKRALAIDKWAQLPQGTSPRIVTMFAEARKSIWGSPKQPEPEAEAAPASEPAQAPAVDASPASTSPQEPAAGATAAGAAPAGAAAPAGEAAQTTAAAPQPAAAQTTTAPQPASAAPEPAAAATSPGEPPPATAPQPSPQGEAPPQATSAAAPAPSGHGAVPATATQAAPDAQPASAPAK
jgi:hypothetical protein